MSWLEVTIPASAEPERVFQISDCDYAVDADGYLTAFSMYSPRYDKVVHMILNKRDAPLGIGSTHSFIHGTRLKVLLPELHCSVQLVCLLARSMQKFALAAQPAAYLPA